MTGPAHRSEVQPVQRDAGLRALLGAVRRVATLVAEGIAPQDLFPVVAEQVARVVDVPFVSVVRYESDGTGTECANASADGPVFPTGTRWSLEGTNVLALVRATGAAARIEDHSGLEGETADAIRRAGIRSAAAVPVVVAGRVWGAVVASTTEATPLPSGTEANLAEFTTLLATGIENAASRESVDRLGAEQAALRRVATLVAQGVQPAEVFAAVSREVDRLFPSGRSAVARFDPDDAALIVVGFGQAVEGVVVGSRWELDDSMASAAVYRTGRPARVDAVDWSAVDAAIAAPARVIATASTVASPIVVEGRLWGVIAVAASEPLPPDATERLEKFTELAATAIANGEAREELVRLADEQATLRRLATLVTHEAPRGEVFTAIAEGIGGLLGIEEVRMLRYEGDESVVVEAGWGNDPSVFPVGARHAVNGDNVASRVLRSGEPARIDNYADASGAMAEAARSVGLRCVVGAPILVDGRVWGLMAAGTMQPDPLARDTGARLAQFTELMATAIANTESRARAERLADEQAALRRVATLVARGAGPEDVFRAVAEEVGSLLGHDTSAMVRFEPDGTATVLGGRRPRTAIGARVALDPGDVVAIVRRTARAARFDADDPTVEGMPEPARTEGIRSAVASPIVVHGELWGAIVAASIERALPRGAERRLADFTDLVATAVANAQVREDVEQLADEQAALRRVATLVAKEARPAEVFAKVVEEAGTALGGFETTLFRDERDGTATVVAVAGFPIAVGTRLPIDGNGVIATVLREGRPCRQADTAARAGAIAARGREMGIRGAVGCPVVVGGRVWGALGAARVDSGPLPTGAETRLAQFAELAATAIANADARAEIGRLADEQAALRRVATLVAEGAAPTAVFDAAAAELGALLHAHGISLCRYEPGDELTVVAHLGPEADTIPPGTRVRHDSKSVTAIVRRTQRPARLDSYVETGGSIGELIGRLGFSAGVGAPIVVEGRLWGVTVGNWTGGERPPSDTEQRMAEFTELLGTAIANADSRNQLMASRARLLSAGDEARRRVVRDLHDGAQQRLVHTIVTLKLAQGVLRSGNGDAGSLVAEALGHAQRSNEELRELAHGIHPPALTLGGLRGAVRNVVGRLDLPVDVDVPARRLPAEIEASAYFIVVEALTNVVKHSKAAHAEVTAAVRDGTLDVRVSDDGVGGADPDGHGLVGMRDRVAALGGRFEIASPAGRGTAVTVSLPLRQAPAGDSR
jgi:GAF domain-containing protein